MRWYDEIRQHNICHKGILRSAQEFKKGFRISNLGLQYIFSTFKIWFGNLGFDFRKYIKI